MSDWVAATICGTLQGVSEELVKFPLFRKKGKFPLFRKKGKVHVSINECLLKAISGSCNLPVCVGVCCQSAVSSEVENGPLTGSKRTFD